MVLVRRGSGTYRRELSDGAVELFDQPVGRQWDLEAGSKSVSLEAIGVPRIGFRLRTSELVKVVRPSGGRERRSTRAQLKWRGDEDEGAVDYAPFRNRKSFLSWSRNSMTKGARSGPSPGRPRGGETALRQAGRRARKASPGVAPRSP